MRALNPDGAGRRTARRSRAVAHGGREMDDLIVLYTTWPDAETAEAFGRRAVEERLAACADVLAPMRSIYRWDGDIKSEPEIPMLLKTTAAKAQALLETILRYHPYETPC